MRTTRSGRAFVKEFHEVFSAFVGGMKLGTHRYLFKVYPNTFTCPEAVATLSDLKFAQTVLQPDPVNPSKIITTTVTTAFSMASDMAHQLCSQFLEANLIFNVLDPKDLSGEFKQDGIYGLTGKGNVLYEVFIRDSREAVLVNGKPAGSAPLATDPAKALLSTRSGTLIELKRDTEDDQLVLDHATIQQVFTSFAGPFPNYDQKANRDALSPVTQVSNLSMSSSSNGLSGICSTSLASSLSSYEGEVAKIPFVGVRVRDRPHNFKRLKASFSGQNAVDWIMAHTTVLDREEAREIASRFLGISYIQNVTGDSSPDIKESRQALYTFTDEGQRIAGWDKIPAINCTIVDATDAAKDAETSFEFGRETSNATGRKISNASSTVPSGPPLKRLSDYFVDAKRHGPLGTGRTQSPAAVAPPTLDLLHLKQEPNDQPLSNAQKLICILENTALEGLFRDFLSSMICSENLEFYHEVIAFKSHFGEKPACLGPVPEKRNPPIEIPKMVKGAARIYGTYLGPNAPKDINVNHNARQDIIQYMNSLGDYVALDTGLPRQPPASNATIPRELPKLTAKIFNKFEDHIFHLMASDSVPKFVKTAAFKEAVAAGNYPGLSVVGNAGAGTTIPTASQAKTGADPVKELAAMRI